MRPELNINLDPSLFLEYYWLKEELSDFCRKQAITASGSKDELTARIHSFLKNGTIPEKRPQNTKVLQQSTCDSPLSPDSLIQDGYRNDERHRSFFKKEIGEHFKFNVPFMSWMKANAGKTYREAITEWKQIDSEKKSEIKREIGSQFQYNQYTRDFFAVNPDRSREEALRCWNYKKSLPGHNRYEPTDLVILDTPKE